MKNKISASIMLHPKREKYRRYLIEALSGFNKVFVSVDRGLGLWDTAERAWAEYDASCDYHLVVQDDAIICDNFYERLDREIVKYPDIAYCLYMGNRDGVERIINGWEARGGVMRRVFGWGVATCLSVRLVDDFLKFSKTSGMNDHDDGKLTLFARSISLPVWCPIPCLVSHRWDEASIMEDGKISNKRQAIIYKQQL